MHIRKTPPRMALVRRNARDARLEGSRIPDAFQQLAAARARGCLVSGSSRLWFDDGRIVRARVPDGDRRLGLRLIAGGHVLPRELTRARRLAGARRTLAEVLLERGIVRRDVVAQIEREQAREAVVALLLEEATVLAFEEGADAPEPLLDLDPADLLAEGEETLIDLAHACRFAPPTATPCLAGGLPGPEAAISPEDWAIISRIDGARTIGDLAEECGFSPVDASLAVFRMASLGLVDVEVADPAGSEAWAARVEGAASAVSGSTGAGGAEDGGFPTYDPGEDLWAAGGGEADESDLFEEIDAARDDVTDGVDTTAILRELSALARDPVPGRPDRSRAR